MTSEELKTEAAYFFCTATGLLATGTLLGAVLYVFTGKELFFTTCLVGYLVSRSNVENPSVIVVDKQQFQKMQEDE
jgi:hypothetical protein